MADIDFALGVIAGEGTFTIGIKRADGRVYLAPYFQLRMNECDERLIRDCREAIGYELGTLRDADSDMFNWRVENKDQCLQLVNIIEAYATEIWYRSEKGKNFKTWAKLVRIHADGRTNDNQRIEMAKIARKSLNRNASNSKSVEDWTTLIETFEKQRDS